MSSIARGLLAAAALSFLAGCAGTDFRRPDSSQVLVGRSTADDVARLMGTPRQTGEALVNQQKVKTMTYAYAVAGGEPLYAGVVPARAMVFTTHEGVVVGQEFVSSFKQDATDFDDSKITAVIKGTTTRQQVVALLGKPNGQAVYPVIKEKGHTGVLYTYGQAKGTVFNMKFHNKILIISFNPADVVSDVAFTSSGEK